MKYRADEERAREMGGDEFEKSDAHNVACDTKLNKSFLPAGSVLTVTYDYGATTTLYLKC